MKKGSTTEKFSSSSAVRSVFGEVCSISIAASRKMKESNWAAWKQQTDKLLQNAIP